METAKGLPGIRVLLTVWIGQLISFIGSGLSSFALGVWMYQQTRSATLFALNSFFVYLPGVLLSPIAGPLVDRWDRRRVMMFSDLGAGLSILTAFGLYTSGTLAYWHIYVVTAVASVCNAFRWPAFIAATTLLVPKKHLGRASGFVQMAQAVSQVLSPALAGVLLSFVGLNGILLMDVVSFLFSLASLWIVRFPHPHGEKKSGSLFQEAAEGWQYIARRRGLLMLLLYFTIINFLVAFISVLVTPLVMSTSSEVVLGTIMSAGGVGMLVGSFVMSVWGGPKRRVYGVLGFTLLSGVAIVCGGLRFSPLLFMVCAFAFFLSVPIVAGCSQAIWQAKVNPDLQGRVFALVRMAILSAMPVATALAGPLADHVFEPLMAVHGPLSDSIGRLIGTGPGRGIGLMFVLFGILTAATAVIGYLNPHLRRVELELPDAVSEGEQQAPVSSEQVSATP